MIRNSSNYAEPAWSSKAKFKYQLRLVENGTVSHIDLVLKNYLTVGRHESCDIQLETPSVSRFHAVIQHRGGGSSVGSDEIFIFDLGSTSGTYLNTQSLTAKSYYALQPGDKINFGDSPDFVLCGGPNNYQPPLPVTSTPLASSSSASTSSDHQASRAADEMDSIIHSHCSDHLKSSLATLEKLFSDGKILDEEYYKKKALIQDQMQKQQEEMRQLIIKKKAEARMKQQLEDASSVQKSKQEALKQQTIQNKAANIMDTKNDPSSIHNATISSSPSPSNDEIPTSAPIVTRKIDKSAESAFSSSLSAQNLHVISIFLFFFIF